jgi:hypothetical protein
MKRRLLTLAPAGIAGSTLVLIASPAHAVGSYCDGSSAATAPDGRISVNDGPRVGAGIYSLTAGEVQLGDHEKVAFHLTWKNRSGSVHTIRVKFAGLSISGGDYRRKLFVGGVQVSFGDDMPRISFKNVAPGQVTPEVTVVVKDLNGGVGQFSVGFRGQFKGSADHRCDELVSAVNPTP